MFAPNVSTHQLADSIHHERQQHAAVLHRISQDRKAGDAPVDRDAHRRVTSRRLAAGLAATALTLVIAAAAAANAVDSGPSDAPQMAPANGGSLTLIR